MIRRIFITISIFALILAVTGCNFNETDKDGENQPRENYSENRKSTAGDKNVSGNEDNEPTENNPSDNPEENDSTEPSKKEIINLEKSILSERFSTPEGFERIPAEEGSFAEYLRGLPLKPHGSPVKYYDGTVKPYDVHDAVIDIDVGDRDLQQCADAVMRLRAEYLYGKGLYDKIHFNFTNGFKADYSTWMKGNRIKVEGNKAYWVKRAEPSNDYKSFRQYMDMVFSYAGTLSLSQELKKVDVSEMQIGDVFMKGDLPGHCVIVVDMAKNSTTGETVFMIAQSYMPAQDIHVLKNEANRSISPWYSTDFGETLKTPQWTFSRDQLMRF